MEVRKPVSLEEKKSIQLEMLKEVDAFCRNNDIRYSLAFGTLIGAVRHKGYIPWDDDVDIMMPLPDMLRFKERFHSDSMKYCDVDTTPHYEFAFSRIANTDTFNLKGKAFKTYGICIDTYPIVSIPSDKKRQESYFARAIHLFKKRMLLNKWQNIVLNYLPFSHLLGYDATVKRYRDHLLKHCQPYGSTDCYYTVAGPLSIRNRTMYDHDIFEQLTEIPFEGYNFICIKEYDYFLRLMYGDYMTPPPENERHPRHIGNFYWK